MKREIITTGDGSKTIQMVDWNEQYHSKHGAIQEAYHVFINAGFQFRLPLSELRILEMGLGTGLNALITYLEAGKIGQKVIYTAVEAYPVSWEELQELKYGETLDIHGGDDIFKAIHDAPWGAFEDLPPHFALQKLKLDFREIAIQGEQDLIYFDAFGARVQPELWTADVFGKMFAALAPKGVLVTYSAKGSVRRAMQEVGFLVERLPGPPGKREMLRAVKG